MSEIEVAEISFLVYVSTDEFDLHDACLLCHVMKYCFWFSRGRWGDATFQHIVRLIQISSALLVYDYIITIDQEIYAIWVPKWTGSTLLFLFNRYLSLLSILLNLASFPVCYVCNISWHGTMFIGCIPNLVWVCRLLPPHYSAKSLIPNNIQLSPVGTCLRRSTSPPIGSICT